MATKLPAIPLTGVTWLEELARRRTVSKTGTVLGASPDSSVLKKKP